MEQIKKVRINNDIYVKPNLSADGKPVVWADNIVSVVATSDEQQTCETLTHFVEDGELRAFFYAKQQRYLGKYHVVVILNDGNTATWDAPAFELVATSAEADEDTGLVAIELNGTLQVATGGAVWGKILGDINDQKDLRKFLPFKITDDNAAVELARDIEGLLHKNLTFSFASGRISLPLRKVEGEYVYNSAESPKYPSRIMAAACIPGSCVYDDDNTTPHPLAKIVSVRYDDLYAYITLDTELEDGEYYLSTGQAAGGASIALNGFAGGKQALAMGYSIANGTNAFATGLVTLAEGDRSHAEGFATVAEGMISHAEGQKTLAKGRMSHAEGNYTVAENRGEHAEGQYNVSRKDSEDFGSAGNTAHTVGIGTSVDDRKNAQEVMQNGDFYVMGVGGYDGKSITGAQSIQQVIEGKAGKDEIPVVPEAEIHANTAMRHNHANKATLDNIDAASVERWENKQDSISDLVDIRSGAALGSTAVQPGALQAYTTKRYVDEQLDAKAGKTYVDEQLQTKANASELTELSLRVSDLEGDYATALNLL